MGLGAGEAARVLELTDAADELGNSPRHSGELLLAPFAESRS
jgi:hypothetical protein